VVILGSKLKNKLTKIVISDVKNGIIYLFSIY